MKAKQINFFSGAGVGQEIRRATGDYADKKWLPLHSTLADLQLFHYTDLKGLQGIISTRSLWCSHASTFNDPLEIRHGSRVITDELESFVLNADRNDVQSFLKQLRLQVSNFGHVQFHPFIACFCESGSLLSQWRAYGDDGGGYAVGLTFNDSVVSSQMPSNRSCDRPVFLRKVIYHEEEQRHLVRDYLDAILPTVVNQLDDVPDTDRDRLLKANSLALEAVNVLLDMLLCFKHEAFREEAEWRLIKVTSAHFDPHLLRFDDSGAILRPFRQVHLLENQGRTFPISRVHFGPTHEPFRTGSTLHLFLQHEATTDHTISFDANLVLVDGAGFSLR